MKNWSVDEKVLKIDKKQHAIWQLEQMVNFGLGKRKLNTKNLKKYWTQLHIDPLKKKYLHLLLWPK